MDRDQAREILILYRPGSPEAESPEFVSALEATRQDADLRLWFEEHCEVQRILVERFDAIPVPEGLREQILSERKSRTTPAVARRVAVLALAVVAILAVAGVTSLWLRPTETYEFAAFRHRMAGMVLREYPVMDKETSDLGEIRKYLAQQGAHGNYVLPPSLQQLASTGCKVLNWRGRTVSMICFNSGTNGTPTEPDLFFFVVDRQLVTDSPPSRAPVFGRTSRMGTASWSEGDKAYVLAAEGDEQTLRRYF